MAKQATGPTQTEAARPERKAIPLRLPAALYERLRESAVANHRPVNAEILVALERYLLPACQDDCTLCSRGLGEAPQEQTGETEQEGD